MIYVFCLLTAEECKDPTHFGLNYAKTKQSEWITGPSSGTSEWVSASQKGRDFVYKDGKAYMIHKTYFDTETNKCVVICKESRDGCDTRTEF